MSRLAIIDSGGANIASLKFALERLGIESELTTDKQRLRDASHVILPGVGTAADCMARLEKADLTDTIRTLQQPLLGICVGMQLMFESSAEGNVPCLGLLPGRVQRFPDRDGFPVPHMGWNQVRPCKSTPLLEDIEDGAYVYFVHSYAAPASELALATTDYGGEFTALVQKGNVFGAQFHPERSAKVGAQLLKNFLAVK